MMSKKKYTDNEIHDEINDEKVENSKGFEVKTLTAYVNDEQISADTIYPEETEEEREQRMAIIGSSLEIKNLENQIDEELVRKLRVMDTEQKIEQRIERLKEVLNLLKSHEMLADKKISIPQPKVTKEEEADVDAENQIKNDEITEKKEDKIEGESELKPEVYVNTAEETEIKDDNSKKDMEEESEIKDHIEFNQKQDANEMNVIYEKVEPTSTEDEMEKEKEKDVLQDGDGDGYENGRESGSDSSEKVRDDNEGTVVVKGNLVGGFVNLDGEKDVDAIKKQVRFHLEDDENGEDTNFGINITVADVNRVLLVEEDKGNDEAGKHKIDEIYENFPSSQVSGKKFFEDLEQKEKEKEKYKVETEDISDVEENNANDVEKGKKKETDVNRSDVEDKEQEKNETNEVEQKSGEIDVKNNEKPTEDYVIEEKKEDESSERKTIVDCVDNEKIRKNDENKDTQDGNSEKEEDNIKKVENEEVDETEKNKMVVEVVPQDEKEKENSEVDETKDKKIRKIDEANIEKVEKKEDEKDKQVLNNENNEAVVRQEEKEKSKVDEIDDEKIRKIDTETETKNAGIESEDNLVYVERYFIKLNNM